MIKGPAVEARCSHTCHTNRVSLFFGNSQRRMFRHKKTYLEYCDGKLVRQVGIPLQPNAVAFGLQQIFQHHGITGIFHIVVIQVRFVG